MNNYYVNLQITLQNINSIMNVLMQKLKDEYDSENSVKTLSELEKSKRQTERLLAIHKYLKTPRDKFLRSSQLGLEIQHIVKDYENLYDIAEKYKVDVQEILRYNNLTTNEIKAGMILKIKTTDSQSIEAMKDIPVYGENLEGEEILGKDIPNYLDTDGNGDLVVLYPQDTLKQCIVNNVVTAKGDYPTENLGLDLYSDLKLNDKVAENLWVIKIAQLLESDYRIAKVNNIKVQKDERAYIIRGEVETINDAKINFGV